MSAAVIRAQTLTGRIEGVFIASGPGFETEAAPALQLTYAGIAGDIHAGLTRPSGAREPWYKRGTEMANERQLSILSVEEMAGIAEALNLPALPAGWIGGNLLLSGIAHLTQLPPRSLLMFESGAAVRIDGDNGPCRAAGRGIVRQVPERPDIELGFVKAARHRRGLVGWVEREGEVRAGETVTVRIREQIVYPGAIEG